MGKIKVKYRLIPSIVFTAVIILLVKMYSYEVNIEGYWPNLPFDKGSYENDFFCHIKLFVLACDVLLALLMMTFLLLKKKIKIKMTRLYIPMGVYMLFVLISYMLSDYKFMAWLGGVNRFEGTLTIMCYMFMLFYTINVVDEVKDALIIIGTVLAAVLIECIIGMSQLCGYDFLLSKIMRKIIAGEVAVAGEFRPGQVYQTVYNMNYVSMYMTLIVPILTILIVGSIIIYRDKMASLSGLKRSSVLIFIILNIGFLILVILNLYGTESVGGILGIFVALFLLLSFVLKKKWQKISVIALTITGFATALTIMYVSGKDVNKQIDYIVTEVDRVVTSVDGNELIISYDRENDAYDLMDGEGKYLNVYCKEGKDGQYQIDDNRFRGKVVMIPFVKDNEPIMYMDALSEEFLFWFKQGQTLMANPYLRNVPQDKVASVGFKGHLTAGSGRGYLWSRTIPLLKNYIFAGSGADTFLLVFPQDDYAGKFSSNQFLNIVIDKPHNMYMMMFVCTGGISMVAFIILMVLFVVKALKICRDDADLNNNSINNRSVSEYIYEEMPGKKKMRNLIVLTIVSGTIGFLTAGLFYDSSICVMPLFYGLLGTAIGLMHSGY